MAYVGMHISRHLKEGLAWATDKGDCLSENRPSLHLPVFREIPF